MQNELEIELMKSMIALITQYPDGLERIEAALEVGELIFLSDFQLKCGSIFTLT